MSDNNNGTVVAVSLTEHELSMVVLGIRRLAPDLSPALLRVAASLLEKLQHGTETKGGAGDGER